MTMKMLNFRVDEKIAARAERKAKRVPYRTLSDYLRELVVADLDEKKPSRVVNKGDGE